jgi:ATP-binding cassette subfamily F protein uup
MIALHNVGFLNIIQNFTFDIVQGDKIGILGHNGSGKSTLLNLITEKLTPSTGTVKTNENAKIAYFDQLRSALNDNLSIKENVLSGGDFVDINGKPKHIISYLGDFLFSPQRILTPVKALSGGERARVMLAKLFTQSFNILILDEPTNDLDIETLEILENLLFEWNGTLITVSHDRSFLDNVASKILCVNNGKVEYFYGTATEFLDFQKNAEKKDSAKVVVKKEPVNVANVNKSKLSYNLQRELDNLPTQIEQTELEIEKLQQITTAADFYNQPQEKVLTKLNELSTLEQKLSTLMERFVELDEM